MSSFGFNRIKVGAFSYRLSCTKRSSFRKCFFPIVEPQYHTQTRKKRATFNRPWLLLLLLLLFCHLGLLCNRYIFQIFEILIDLSVCENKKLKFFNTHAMDTFSFLTAILQSRNWFFFSGHNFFPTSFWTLFLFSLWTFISLFYLNFYSFYICFKFALNLF